MKFYLIIGIIFSQNIKAAAFDYNHADYLDVIKKKGCYDSKAITHLSDKCQLLIGQSNTCVSGTIVHRSRNFALCKSFAATKEIASPFDYKDPIYKKGLKDHGCFLEKSETHLAAGCRLLYGDFNTCLTPGRIVFSAANYAICKEEIIRDPGPAIHAPTRSESVR